MSSIKSRPSQKLLIGTLIAVFAALAFVMSQLPLIGVTTQANAAVGDPVIGGVITAPLVDHGDGTGEDPNTNVAPDDYSVAVTSGGEGIFNLAFTATGIPSHYNGGHQKAYWIGFGIVGTEGDTYAIAIKKADEAAPTFKDSDYSEDNYTAETQQGPVKYKTFYCGSYTQLKDKAFYVSVKNGTNTKLYKATFADVKCTYSITYNQADHGKISGDTSAVEGTDVTITSTPDEGYYLSGLRIEGVNANGIVEAEDGTFTMPAYDVLATPTFTECPTVTFKNEDGTVLSSAKYAPGTPAADIKQPATPKKKGNAGYDYEFAGWTPELSNMGIVDVTYTALYKTISKSTAATGVEAEGDVFTKNLNTGESVELVVDVPSKETKEELEKKYAKEIGGEPIGGIFTVDLLKHLTNGAVEDVDSESVGQLTLSFPVDASEGTVVRMIQLHEKTGATEPEVIEHKNLRVENGKVKVTLNGKLSSFILTTQGNPDGVSMYRLYNPNSGEHFYTSDKAEYKNLTSLGWNDEGTGWIAPQKSNTPVYRLYNPNGGEHHYTMDVKEKNGLVALGWNDEGIGWYSDDAEGTVLYREYNPNAFSNNHNYTTDLDEHKALLVLGWKDEGKAWYGLK